MATASFTTKKKSSVPGAGFGLIGLVLALAVVAVGGGVGATMFFGGSGSSNTDLGSGSGSPANRAYDVVAETTLETAESAVQTVATTSGFGGMTAQTLSFDEPSIHFVSGDTTSDTTVSVADSGGSSAITPGTSIQSIVGAVGGGGSQGGGVTLATYSNSISGPGSCLYVWMTTGATWFGSESDQTSCTATALATAPTAGPVSSSAIGWSSTSFPTP